MRRLITSFTVLISLLLCAADAQGSIHVSFVKDTGYLKSYVVKDIDGSGVDLVATGYQNDEWARVDLDGEDSRSGKGMGVVGRYGEEIGDDDLEPLPTYGYSSETLKFAFYKTGTYKPVKVWLEKIWFSNVDKNDNFDMAVDGHWIGNEIPLYGDGNNPYMPVPSLAGSVFKVRADGYGKYKYIDNFKVKKLKFDPHMGGKVPEPASFAVWACLVGIVVSAARRKRSAV